jgi:hypothetical protein
MTNRLFLHLFVKDRSLDRGKATQAVSEKMDAKIREDGGLVKFTPKFRRAV